MVRALLLRLLFCGLFIVPASGVIARPLAVAGAKGLTTPGFQLYAQLESWDRQLQALDAGTLRPSGNPPRLMLGSPGGYQPTQVLAGADGRTVAVISNRPLYNSHPTQSQYRRAMTIRIVDTRTGARRADFHPAVPLFWAAGLSSDGTQLFGWRQFSPGHRQAEWIVLSTANGAVLDRAWANPICCSQSVYDPATHRLYGLTTPPTPSSGQPATPSLLAFDLTTGRQVGRLSLPGVLAGATMVRDANNAPITKMWQPGFALSPDGSQIAVLDGQSDRLDLIDSRQLTVVRSLELSRPQGLLQWLGGALGVIPATASAKEWLGAMLSLTYSPDGRQLYLTGRQGEIGAAGKWTEVGLGLRLIDLSRGQVVASSLPKQWVTQVLLSPDGHALYAVGQPTTGSSAVVTRQDPESLQVEAQRHFIDPPALYILARPAATPSWLQGWPMPGHDPQRTNLSPVAGPTRPRLVRERSSFQAELIVPDGSIVGTATSQSTGDLATLRPDGKFKILSRYATGAVALRPDGAMLADGANGAPASFDSQAVAMSSTGKVLWSYSPIGLTKGAPPLATSHDQFFIPAVGHPEDGTSGLWILSPAGRVIHQVARGVPTFNVARGRDGSVYTLLYDPTSTASFAVGDSPALRQVWRYRLSGSLEEAGNRDPLMVGAHDRVYVGDGNTLLALDGQGRLAWRFGKADGVLSIAERPDGSLLVAGSRTLTALSSQGQELWDADIHVHHKTGANTFVRAPALAVDRSGNAFVGTADGQVMVVDVVGRVITRVPAGGYHYGAAPGVMLGSHGMLVVSGTDGALRVYAP